MQHQLPALILESMRTESHHLLQRHRPGSAMRRQLDHPLGRRVGRHRRRGARGSAAAVRHHCQPRHQCTRTHPHARTSADEPPAIQRQSPQPASNPRGLLPSAESPHTVRTPHPLTCPAAGPLASAQLVGPGDGSVIATCQRGSTARDVWLCQPARGTSSKLANSGSPLTSPPTTRANRETRRYRVQECASTDQRRGALTRGLAVSM